MGLLGLAGLVAIIVGAYWWAVLPQLRKLAWWDSLVIRLWAFAGNSKTIAVAYASELLGLLDEAAGLVDARRFGAGRARHGGHGRGDDRAPAGNPRGSHIQAAGVSPCCNGSRNS